MDVDLDAKEKACYSKDIASANWSAISAFSDKFLPLLFNIFCDHHQKNGESYSSNNSQQIEVDDGVGVNDPDNNDASVDSPEAGVDSDDSVKAGEVDDDTTSIGSPADELLDPTEAAASTLEPETDGPALDPELSAAITSVNNIRNQTILKDFIPESKLGAAPGAAAGELVAAVLPLPPTIQALQLRKARSSLYENIKPQMISVFRVESEFLWLCRSISCTTKLSNATKSFSIPIAIASKSLRVFLFSSPVVAISSNQELHPEEEELLLETGSTRDRCPSLSFQTARTSGRRCTR
ncbi:hypothetical protein SELMODRAFT_419805 [Selaginella moellendorffii]|uniref:Uncharacterized protein n=1 Tax=Selaginella moellendorffii TaxID=88036 RepID=D8SAL7_SELML|nr:hypothetical protein SELMODRAFT_419805 [Selaginella moellendorffii]